jgi:serpin B
MVLTNTVYVSSAWEKPFVVTNSSDQSFTTPTGAKNLPFMRSFEPYDLVDTDFVSAVELPLAIPGLAMDLIVPKGDLAAYEADLTGASLNALLDSMVNQDAIVSLPKFKLEPTAEGSLKPQLQALGMRMAFDSGVADFSGIADGGLTLADVVQKTFFTADEGGLEAAAGSAVLANRKSSSMGAFQFVADRPFLVVLRDVQTRTVLFLGHVVDPSVH